MNSNYSLEGTILDTELRHINFRGCYAPIRAISGWRLGPTFLPRPVVLGESYLSESLIDAGPLPSEPGRIIMGAIA